MTVSENACQKPAGNSRRLKKNSDNHSLQLCDSVSSENFSFKNAFTDLLTDLLTI